MKPQQNRDIRLYEPFKYSLRPSWVVAFPLRFTKKPFGTEVVAAFLIIQKNSTSLRPPAGKDHLSVASPKEDPPYGSNMQNKLDMKLCTIEGTVLQLSHLRCSIIE